MKNNSKYGKLQSCNILIGNLVINYKNTKFLLKNANNILQKPFQVN